MVRTVRIVGQNPSTVMLGSVSRAAFRRALQRVASELFAGQGLDLLWPGVDRQPTAAIDLMWAVVSEGVSRGARVRVFGFRFRRPMVFPDGGDGSLGPAAGQVELAMPATSQSVRVARRLIYRVAGSFSWAESDRHDLLLAASEALNNAVRHGSPRGGRDLVALRLTTHEGGLKAAIMDFGSWDEGIPADDLPDYGRGLAIMQASVDAVQVDRKHAGTVVTLVKRDRQRVARGSALLG